MWLGSFDQVAHISHWRRFYVVLLMYHTWHGFLSKLRIWVINISEGSKSCDTIGGSALSGESSSWVASISEGPSAFDTIGGSTLSGKLGSWVPSIY